MAESAVLVQKDAICEPLSRIMGRLGRTPASVAFSGNLTFGAMWSRRDYGGSLGRRDWGWRL